MGHAVVLWSPFVPFDQVAALGLEPQRSPCTRPSGPPTTWPPTSCARTRPSRPTTSSTCPSRSTRPTATSCGSRPGSSAARSHLAELRELAQSPFGDIDEYRAIPSRSRPPGRDAPGRGRTADRSRPALARLRPGDVVMLDQGQPRRPGRGAHRRTLRKSGPRVRAVTTDAGAGAAVGGRLRRAAPRGRPHRAAHAVRARTARATSARWPRRLERAKLASRPGGLRAAAGRAERDRTQAEAVATRSPTIPDLAERLRAAAQAERVAREVDELRRRVRGRSESLARRFDRVLRILEAWGYLDGCGRSPTAASAWPGSFHECDLLVVECLRQGLLDDLDAGHAGRAGVGVHLRAPQSRAPAGAVVPVGHRCGSGGSRIEALARELAEMEDEAGLPLSRLPDPTFVAVAYAWAAGEGFAEVVEAEELSGGDFVRNIKQLIDLLRQLAEVAPSEATRSAGGRRRRAPVPRRGGRRRRVVDDSDEGRQDEP